MGLPFVVLNMVTVLMFKGLEVDDKLITFWTSLILLPWTLKPLWSPFLELFRTKKFFVIVTQLITGVTFGLVAFALNLSHFFSISIALLAIVAFSGATHDIACDGVYMSELLPGWVFYRTECRCRIADSQQKSLDDYLADSFRNHDSFGNLSFVCSALYPVGFFQKNITE